MTEPTPVDVAALRQEYAATGLDAGDLADDPLTQFRRWLDAAVAAGVREPNAMVLATAGADGTPSARTVLLKGVDARGFAFFTNLGSRKARELDGNPHAAVVFPWIELGRQVTARGRVIRVPDPEADAYFATRPRGAQLGAWASLQSEALDRRATLEQRLADVTQRFDGTSVPRPDGWGGFRLLPDEVEFWQGRPNRLHDRLVYLAGDGGWVLQRRYP